MRRLVGERAVVRDSRRVERVVLGIIEVKRDVKAVCSGGGGSIVWAVSGGERVEEEVGVVVTELEELVAAFFLAIVAVLEEMAKERVQAVGSDIVSSRRNRYRCRRRSNNLSRVFVGGAAKVSFFRAVSCAPFIPRGHLSLLYPPSSKSVLPSCQSIKTQCLGTPSCFVLRECRWRTPRELGEAWKS